MDVLVLPDTGFTRTTLENKAVRALGIDLLKGPSIEGGDFYIHNLQVKIGSLAPIPVAVNMSSGKNALTLNILGMVDMHKFYKITFTKSTITFQDRATVVTPAAALLASMPMSPSAAHWRSRI